MIYRMDFSKEHEGPCFEPVSWPLTLNTFSYRKNKGKTALKQRSKLGPVLPQFCLCFVCVLSTLNAPIANLGQQTVIIGHSWLTLHNPEVDWATQKVSMMRCPPAAMAKSCQSLIPSCRSPSPHCLLNKETLFM